jgi:hypothetical protein
VDSLRSVQFQQELREAGYVESSNPRDIDIGQKLSVLRTHIARWRNHKPSKVETVDLSSNIHQKRDPVFSGGILSHWSVKNPLDFKYLPARLDLVQLASPNKGTHMKKWHVWEPKISVRQHWMDPTQDLLVLLELLDSLDEEGQPAPTVRLRVLLISIQNSPLVTRFICEVCPQTDPIKMSPGLAFSITKLKTRQVKTGMAVGGTHRSRYPVDCCSPNSHTP